MVEDDYTNINVKVTREQLQKIKDVVQALNVEKPARKYTQNSICVDAIEAYCDRQLRRAAKKKK